MANLIRDDDDAVEYNYDFNGDDDEDDIDYSSSEDVVNRFVSSRRGYTTFDNDTVGKQQSADDAIYGVFASNDDDEKVRRSVHYNPSSVSFVPSSRNDSMARAEEKEEAKEENKAEEDEGESSEMKKANDHFHELLQRSQQRKRKRTQTQQSNDDHDNDSQSKSHDLPEQFGGLGFGKKKQPKPATTKIDPTLGTWEKHTKGIGMKLLTKMGYSGSGGLGSKKQKKEGISRPVQVVVRPTNLGLGFGSFREAAQLTNNRIIEAQVLGKEPPHKLEKTTKSHKSTAQTHLPTTSHLLQQASWRKTTAKKPKKQPIFVSYQDLMNASNEKKEPVIIDMRGPSTSTSTKKEQQSTVVPLGEELLYNVTFILQTTQNKLLTAASTQKLKESQQKEISNELQKYQQKCQELSQRESHLQELYNITSIISKKPQSMEQIVQKIAHLRQNLSTEEIKSLNFYEFWVPRLLGSTLLLTIFPQWKLLSSTSDHKKKISAIFRFCTDCCPDDSSFAVTIQTKIMQEYVIPFIKQTLQQIWDPIQNAGTVLDLYQILKDQVMDLISSHTKSSEKHNDLEKTNTMDSNGGVFEDSKYIFSNVPKDGHKGLISTLEDEILQSVIFMKLQNALQNWKPKINDRHQVANSFHSWVLPWIIWFHGSSANNINHDILVKDIELKLTSGLKQLSSRVNENVKNHDDDYISFFHGCLSLYKPWMSIILHLSSASIRKDNSAIKSILYPRLGKYLSRIKIQIHVQNQDWTFLNILEQLFQNEILSDLDYLCFIEGEVLPNWYQTLYEAIQQKQKHSDDADYNSQKEKEEMVLYYMEWKRRLLLPPSTHIKNNSTSSYSVSKKKPHWKVLHNDSIICRYFYGGLRLLEDISTNEKRLQGECAVYQHMCNYHQAQLRRLRETLLKEKEREMRGTTVSNDDGGKVSSHRSHVMMKNSVTFRQVLEHVTRQQNISFYPKPNTYIDGKQIYILEPENDSSSPVRQRYIYVDSNVIFICKKESTIDDDKMTTTWHPISMDELLSAI